MDNPHAYRLCPECIDYAERRQPVLVPAFVDRKRRTGETTEQVIDAYMNGVHTRHLAGDPI